MGMTAFRTDMIVGMTMRVVMVMVVAICMMMMAVVAMIMMIMMVMMVMIDVNRTMFGGSQSNRLHAAPRKQFAP